MKPLPAAPLTQEDWLAWLHARHGFHAMPWFELIEAYKDSERRDADLMLFFMSLEWTVLTSKAHLFLRLQAAAANPVNWHTVLQL